MADETRTQRIRSLRGKRLDAPESVALWQHLHASRLDDSSSIPPEGTTRPEERRAHSNVDTAPGSLEEWVLVNRALRGIHSESIARNRLYQHDLDALEQPRCGLWRVTRDLIPDHLSQRFKFREWLNQAEVGWERSQIQLAIHPNSRPPQDIPVEQYEQAVDRAIASWNRAEVGIEIQRVNSLQNIEILVQWSTPDLDAHRLLSDAVLAHADYPPPNMHLVARPPLPICLNKTVFWAPEDAGGAVIASRYDVESFVLHELGHCLGLFHKSEGSVMYEIVKKGRHRILDPESIQAARALYAASPGSIA